MRFVFQKSIIVFACGVLLPIYSSAGGLQPDQLEKLLRDARAAVGSENDLARIRSLSMVADCMGPKGKYTTSIDSFRVNKTRFVQTFTYKDEPSSVFVNGETAWTIDGHSGDALLSSPFVRMVARAHEYQKMAYDVGAFFQELEIAGTVDFEGRVSIKVSAKNELGMPVDLFFDQESKRLNGYVLSIPDSTETIKNVFLKWRRVGRLMLPFIVRATDKDGDWTLRFDRIAFNKATERLLDIPPRVTDTAEILRLHELQKKAHLTYDAELLLSNSQQTLVSVQRGDVITRTRDEDLARFGAYFSSFKFIEWEDIAPPKITISKDGSLATKIVRKRVRGISKDAAGTETQEHTIFAWLEVLEKINGQWRLTTIASTEKKVEN